jgi:hypothetical protein
LQPSPLVVVMPALPPRVRRGEEPPLGATQPAAARDGAAPARPLGAACVIRFYDAFLASREGEGAVALVMEQARRLSIDPLLTVALVEAESEFNPRATGDDGHSWGLFQLDDRWHSQERESVFWHGTRSKYVWISFNRIQRVASLSIPPLIMSIINSLRK